MSKLFSFIFAVLFATNLFAGNKTLTTFMPQNDLDKEDGLFDNGMTQYQFNQIIDSVEKYYVPIVKQLGATLIINRKWSDATVNAQAYQQGDSWYVDMFGGLARRPEITFDGFAMVLCHEIGHHLGGFPFVESWAADEGQSDYFAMHGCAKEIWKNDDNVVENVDSFAKNLCDNNFDQDLPVNLCYREMNAAFSLATLLGTLGGEKTVSFTTPDKKIVRSTNHSHPKAQCRLDTYVAGTLCNEKWNNEVIPQTEKESGNYLCLNKSVDGNDIQSRPRCWFKPSFVDQ